MATALQRQLAQISANSTHQLDLKAQKTQHARSLLFEPRDAAKQSFDDIYNICIEGFEELCQLDSRFNQFANNLFGEGSKDIDRGQLTKAENEELDAVIERYLGLVQGRLLLKPAQKSLEWLVRRLRVHEFNTEALLLTFLPYYTDQRIFPTVLAILPTDRALPESFKWLHPYIASFSCPPRHAVLAAIISNRSLYSAFNSYVLRVAKAGYASSILLGYWAGIIAQAVNGMLDSSRTGRDSVRRQREEDILLKVLPVIQDALSTSKKRKLDEIFVGACMIATILGTKASLSDAALDAMMEAVVSAWTDETMDEGVSCLAALAEEKEESSLPALVVKRMLSDRATASLLRQSASQRTGKLSAGFAHGIFHLVFRKHDLAGLPIVQQLLEADILSEQDMRNILQSLMDERERQSDVETFTAAPDAIANILDSEKLKDLLEQHGLTSGMQDIVHSGLEQAPVLAAGMELDLSDDSRNALHSTDFTEFKNTLDALPQLPSENHSFLTSDSSNARLFDAYSQAFKSTLRSEQHVRAFLNVKSLQTSNVFATTALLTLFARIWSTENPDIPTTAKVKALQIIDAHLESHTKVLQGETSSDQSPLAGLQQVIPYLLTALADENRRVRSTAAALCRTIQKHQGTSEDKSGTSSVRTPPSLYDIDERRSVIDNVTLTTIEAHKFLDNIITPALEECILGTEYIVRHTTETLNGSDPNTSRQLTQATRASICNFLAFHANKTPVLLSKLTLLRILGSLHKDVSDAREQFLLPFVKQWASLSTEQVRSWCEDEGVKAGDVDIAVLGVLSRKSDEQMKILRDICSGSEREDLIQVAFERLQQLWSAFKSSQARLEVVEWLLKLALHENEATELVREYALETLRAFQLSPEIAAHMLQSIPATLSLTTQPPPTKRQRRTSEAERPRAVDVQKLEVVIRRFTLILELLESSKQSSPELLKPLFHLLAELRQLKTLLDSELVYLHGLLLDRLLAVVSSLRNTSSQTDKLAKDVMRIDLLVDCVRSTSSTQVHNSALLVVSELASFAPESVLHSIIPLFTFMSSTVLRRTDEYSAHVTDQAVTRIIPALAQSLKKKGSDLLGGVSELLLSFVAAWEHIPLHRRLGLFEILVRAIGADDCLGIVAAMLVERYSSGRLFVSTFIVELTGCFEANTVLKAANSWLHLIFDALKPRTNAKQRKLLLSDSLLSLADKDKTEQVETVQALIDGLALLLHSETLRERVAISLSRDNKRIVETIHSANVSLTEQTILLEQLPEVSSDTTLKSAANNLLSAVLGLLPTDDFIASCAQLMQSGSSSVREQVFHSLESRVTSSKSGNAMDRRTFLNVLPSCAIFVSEDQPVEVRTAAIGCIDSICEKFGKSDRDSVKNAAVKVASGAALGAEDSRLRTLSLLCLASMIGVLGDGDESASILPDVLSRTLDLLERSSVEELELQNAAFRVLTALLDHIPWMLASSPSNLKRAIQSAVRNGTVDAASEFRTLVAKQVPAAGLFKGIEATWSVEIERLDAALLEEQVAVGSTFQHLLSILHEAVQRHTKATIAKNASSLFGLILKAFDLRRLRSRVRVGDEETIGDTVLIAVTNDMAIDATLKMNDATFRPFFNRLVEWPTSELPKGDTIGRTERWKSVYSFTLVLFEKLKSLVTSYMSFLLDNVGETLREAQNGVIDLDLLDMVTMTLGSSFRNDEDDFWTAPAHFDVVASPLINLLGSQNAQSSERIDLLTSTITDFAGAVTSSPEQLKAINGTLLSLLRHEQANIRLAAVQCERAVTKSVSFDWLALLPELLPAISELQEDDDERVEHQTLLWVREIEEISGESLEGMLA